MANRGRRHGGGRGQQPPSGKMESKASKKSNGLPEISAESWQHWDSITAQLKEYFSEHYGILSRIFPDPLRLTQPPAYAVQPVVSLQSLEDALLLVVDRVIAPIPAVADGNAEVAVPAAPRVPDPVAAIRRTVLIAQHNAKSTAFEKEELKRMDDRRSGYSLLRSLTTEAVNEQLANTEAFIACEEDDPLELWRIIKSEIMTRSEGHTAHDKDSAWHGWHTLSMHQGESALQYGKRAVALYDRLTHAGIEVAQLPSEPEKAMKYVNGLLTSVPAYAEYLTILRNSVRVFNQSVYPLTLTLAIKQVSLYRIATPTKQPHSQSTVTTTQTALAAQGPEKFPKGKKKPFNKKEGKDSKTDPKDEAPFPYECFNCGKVGHRAAQCPDKKKESKGGKGQKTVRFSKEAPPPVPEAENDIGYWTSFSASAISEINPPVLYQPMTTAKDTSKYQTFPQRTKPSGYRKNTVYTVRSKKRKDNRLGRFEAIFDTGATGTIAAEEGIVQEITPCEPTNYNGLNGSLLVNRSASMGSLGRVHFDPRAGITVISASQCLRQGHSWEYVRGSCLEQDAFLVHTKQHTYVFRYRDGLYVADLSKQAVPRYTSAPPPRMAHLRMSASLPTENILYTVAKLPTTAENETTVSTRQKLRSIEARKFQASLGFPGDKKLIASLNAGTFLNCDILPSDVTRATDLWGPNIAIIQGRTNRMKPLPPPQNPLQRRSFSPQEMLVDILFINKIPVVISLTQPIGVTQVACVVSTTAALLRPVLRRFFGTLNQRNIDVVRFISDNEKGLIALFSEMGAMSVEVITVGAGQHDHIAERGIRTFKEVLRPMIASLPYMMADNLLPHAILAAAKKLLFFASPTRPGPTPFEHLFNRKADKRIDIGPPFGSYCHVTNRVLTNNMDARTVGCLYLEPRMNGTGTHSFMRLDNRTIISANHFVVLPITPMVIAVVNGWAARNKDGNTGEPIFIYKDQDITDWSDDSADTPTFTHTGPPTEPTSTSIPSPFSTTTMDPDLQQESPTEETASEEPRGEEQDQEHSLEDDQSEHTGVIEPMDPQPAVQENMDLEPAVLQEIPPEIQDPPPTQETPFMQRKSGRITKPVDRLNLQASEESMTHHYCGMTTTRAMKLFPEEARKAMEVEIRSLLGKETFQGVFSNKLSAEQKKKSLRTIMNINEKWLPNLDDDGHRLIDKIKARFCVDGRGQNREEYTKDEIESPTASTAAIMTVAQIAAKEGRHVSVGDVGTAYLNAYMPSGDPNRHVHILIEKDIASIIIEVDSTYTQFRRPDGRMLVRLRKALYGCIESAKLWYSEITGTLIGWGFTANPRDPCILNKTVRGVQLTVVLYVDDFMMTCIHKEEVDRLSAALRSKYKQFRTTDGPIVPYLGCIWDYSGPGFVSISQTGMIQDLIVSRETTLKVRGVSLKANVNSPGAPYLFERTPESPLLSDKDKALYHTDTAIALYIGQKSRPDLTTVIGELSKRVQSPTVEDDLKLNRLIGYLKRTRDVPLRLGCDLIPQVTVSIDAAFANREWMRSTSGLCVTLGIGFFIAWCKVQNLNSKSSTEAEIIAVSDGMNLPMWLADFIHWQGYPKKIIVVHQDNQSAIVLLTKGRSTAETTKFVDIRFFWVTDYIKKKVMELVYVPTGEMTSDYFTKPLQGSLFNKMVKRILGQKE